MKKLISAVLAGSMAMSLAACGGSAASSQAPAASGGGSPHPLRGRGVAAPRGRSACGPPGPVLTCADGTKIYSLLYHKSAIKQHPRKTLTVFSLREKNTPRQALPAEGHRVLFRLTPQHK